MLLFCNNKTQKNRTQMGLQVGMIHMLPSCSCSSVKCAFRCCPLTSLQTSIWNYVKSVLNHIIMPGVYLYYFTFRDLQIVLRNVLNVACLLCVCVLTVSRCMNPQIPAATSQANRITRQVKNCRTHTKNFIAQDFVNWGSVSEIKKCLPRFSDVQSNYVKYILKYWVQVYNLDSCRSE